MKIMYFYKAFFILLFVWIASCKNRTNDGISIQYTKQCGCISVRGVSPVAVTGLRNDTLALAAWQLLFPVSEVPADTSLRNTRPPINGKYQVKGSQIIFTPATAFNPNKTYVARFYRYNEQADLVSLIIKKRLPGQAAYTELIFK